MVEEEIRECTSHATHAVLRVSAGREDEKEEEETVSEWRYKTRDDGPMHKIINQEE